MDTVFVEKKGHFVECCHRFPGSVLYCSLFQAMSHIIQRVFQTFSLRLFLNIVLWLVIGYDLFYGNIPETHIVAINVYKSVSVLSLLLFTYVNNLLLIPHFLAKRKFVAYLALAFLLIVGYALLYSVFIELVVHQHRDIELYQIVLFSVIAKAEWSLSMIRKATIGYSFVFGIWLLVLTMAWYMHDHARQRKAMLLVQQQQTETELSFLKAQINPHFLFNTLNNLYALALKKSDQSPDAILKLSSILRYLLYDSNTPTVPFHKEQEIMEAYIDIERLRLDDDTTLDITITADEPRQIPPLIWLPILENVFKHGTRTIAGDNRATFRFEIHKNQLIIHSRNKEKQPIPRNKEQSGIGLNNLRKRLELLYPGKHSMSAMQENNEYISEVIIDLA